MAEMCSLCKKEHGFNEDINIKLIFDELNEGFETSVICEGCAMTSIGKSFDGKCIVFFGMFCPVISRRSKWFFYDLDKNEVGDEYKIMEDNKK